MTISTTNGETPNPPGASTYSAFIQEELRRYDEHLRDVRGLSVGTRKDRLRIIGLLLEGKFKRRRNNATYWSEAEETKLYALNWQALDATSKNHPQLAHLSWRTLPPPTSLESTI